MTLIDLHLLVISLAALIFGFNINLMFRELKKQRQHLKWNTHRIFHLEGGECRPDCPVCRDMEEGGVL